MIEKEVNYKDLAKALALDLWQLRAFHSSVYTSWPGDDEIVSIHSGHYLRRVDNFDDYEIEVELVQDPSGTQVRLVPEAARVKRAKVAELQNVLGDALGPNWTDAQLDRLARKLTDMSEEIKLW